MIELILITIGITSLYLAHYAYIRMRGYLDLDFYFQMEGTTLPDSLLVKMKEMLRSGISKPFEGTFDMSIDIKNTGYQNITIEKIVIERVAFLPSHKELLLSRLNGSHRDKMQKEINSFLQGRTFSEINKLILLEYQKSLISESLFNPENGALYIQLNTKPITLKRKEKYKLSVTDILSDIYYEFEGKNFTYATGKVYCLDTLGRTWTINKKTKELFMMYSIGLEESYLNNIRNMD